MTLQLVLQLTALLFVVGAGPLVGAARILKQL